MKFPKLKIGSLIPKYPIIQGGMAIKISMADLASAVANQGGIGVIAGTAIPVEEIREEIKKAKSMTDGILGVNIMFAAREFKKLLIASIESGIDLIISGAGFSRDMFTIGKEYNVPVVPIVSSLRLAKISEKLGAAAIVIEGGNAGGHLGTDQDAIPLIKKIKDKVSIPAIGAGDIVTPQDVDNIFKMGLAGVQMGTRFLASKEANIADTFKELCVKTKKEEIVKIMSSVGLPANAIRTKFIDLIINGKAPEPENCDSCLKKCTKNFCIRDALLKGRKGDLEEGVFFTGEGLWKIDKILSVKEIFEEIKNYKSQL
ncbi:MAG: nitronate monooxygenase [Halanaerobiales bacterium]|nr:nitronate monooxygenase [Halanaerobiales bacterium]